MLIVGCASQKGGVAKSSLARLLAREFAERGRRVLLADLDVLQGTTLDWSRRRAEAGHKPGIAVERFGSVEAAVKAARQQGADCLVLDARGVADAQTLEVARAADALLIPSGLAVDDLAPAVRLAHELVQAGVPRGRLAVALCRTGDSVAEIAEAAEYVGAAGYRCLDAVWPERAGYRRAHDEGRAATESRHPTLREKAHAVADSAIAFIESQNGKQGSRKRESH